MGVKFIFIFVNIYVVDMDYLLVGWLISVIGIDIFCFFYWFWNKSKKSRFILVKFIYGIYVER